MTTIRILDLETTGLPPDAEVCEYATFDLVGEGQNWERGRMLGSLVDPGVPIPPTMSAIHHIVDADVQGKPKWMEASRAFASPPPDIWCAHHNRFEMRFFNPPGAKWIDTYRAALWLWPDAPGHSNQCLRYWLGLKLSDPVMAVPHRAFGDAYVTAAILRRMLREVQVNDLLLVSMKPALLPRLTFGKHAMLPVAEVPAKYWLWITEQKDDHGLPAFDEDVVHTAWEQLKGKSKQPKKEKVE